MTVAEVSQVSTPAGHPNETLPESKDMISGYKANYEAFQYLRLLWSNRTEFTDNHFLREQEVLEELKKKSESPRTPPAQVAEAKSRLQALEAVREDPAHGEPIVSVQEYITDRLRYQM